MCGTANKQPKQYSPKTKKNREEYLNVHEKKHWWVEKTRFHMFTVDYSELKGSNSVRIIMFVLKFWSKDDVLFKSVYKKTSAFYRRHQCHDNINGKAFCPKNLRPSAGVAEFSHPSETKWTPHLILASFPQLPNSYSVFKVYELRRHFF